MLDKGSCLGPNYCSVANTMEVATHFEAILTVAPKIIKNALSLLISVISSDFFSFVEASPWASSILTDPKSLSKMKNGQIGSCDCHKPGHPHACHNFITFFGGGH